jgi:hypothetical protein
MSHDPKKSRFSNELHVKFASPRVQPRELTYLATGPRWTLVLAIRIGIGDRPSFQKDNGHTES